MQNGACTEKAYAADNLGCDTRRVTALADIFLQLGSLRINIIKAVKRNEHKQRRAHAHKNVRTETGRAVTTASFYTDNAAENCSNNQPDNHNNLFVMQKRSINQIHASITSQLPFPLPAPGADTGTELFLQLLQHLPDSSDIITIQRQHAYFTGLTNFYFQLAGLQRLRTYNYAQRIAD